MLVELSILILALSPSVLGVTTFTPNCTASNEPVNFVYSSGYRSTLNILWSSLFTIIACTWTILHLNVPEQRNGRDPGFWGDLKWTLKRTCKSLKWMLATIVAPEVTLGLAASRLERALESRKKFKHFADMDGVEWTLEHGFYADMGGFAIKIIMFPEEGSVPDVTFHLTSFQLLQLRTEGYIKKLPEIPVEQINDQSKSDTFTKLITAVQVSSTIIQVIVRRSKNFAISQLELAVTAFSVCATITYLLTLYQPKGVQTVRVLRSDGQKISFKNLYKIYCTLDETDSRSDTKDKSYFLHGGVDKGVTNYLGKSIKSDTWYVMSVVFAGTLFGAVHCCGWHFEFPTAQELLLWRVASVITTGAPIILFSISYLLGNMDGLALSIVGPTFFILMFIYTISRLFIIIEVFRSLFYLPVDAFISTWADNIPRVS